MAISYKRAYFTLNVLQIYAKYDIILLRNKFSKERIHASDTRNILDTQRGGRTVSRQGADGQKLHQERSTQGYPLRRQLAYLRRSFKGIYRTAKQKIALVEAINVKSHCRYGLDNFLRQWLRNKVSLLEIFRVPLCLVYPQKADFASARVGSVMCYE